MSEKEKIASRREEIEAEIIPKAGDRRRDTWVISETSTKISLSCPGYIRFDELKFY